MFLIKYFILLNLLILSLLSDVKLNLPSSFIKGEAFIFSLEINGNDINLPNLSKIQGNIVQELSSSTSTSIVNSNISKIIKKTYSIYPNESFIFPILKFNVDGKVFISEEKKIEEKTVQKTKSKIFDLIIKTDKTDFYVGENFIVTLVFKYRRDAQIVDLNFESPNFDNFWFKQLDETKKYEQNSFIVQELKFLLFPLKEGIQKISPVNIQAQVVDNNANSYSLFSNQTRNIKIYSNELNFNIKKLPAGVNLIGDFDIKASINKSDVINAEAVSYKLEINGFGNIEDIKDIKLEIPNTTIYENKPKIEAKFKDNKYQGKYEKTYSIIANESFVIPSVKLQYFDKKENKLITKMSKAFNINVKNENINNEVSILEKKEKNTRPKIKEVVKIVEKTSVLNNIIYFALGIFITLLILGLYLYVINYKRKEKSEDIPLIKQVKKSSSKIQLLKILAVYIKINPQLDEMIFKLERTDDFDSLKKEIIKFLKQTKLQG